MAPSSALPLTLIEFVSRLTAHSVTPGTSFTAFSTLALHAAQLIPVTSNCFINKNLSVATLSLSQTVSCPSSRKTAQFRSLGV